MNYKRIIASIYILNGKAVKGIEAGKFIDENPVSLAKYYCDNGADELLIFNLSNTEAAHEQTIHLIKQITTDIDIPVIAGGNISRVEDVKKLLYAGCKKAMLNFNKPENVNLFEEVSKRFGKDKIACAVDYSDILINQKDQLESYASELFIFNLELLEDAKNITFLPIIPVIASSDFEEVSNLLMIPSVAGVVNTKISDKDTDFWKIKKELRALGIETNLFDSSLSWSEFKLNEAGLIPVIVQDYKTNEVLMMAYMNEASFEKTLETGKMTYWSRSRDELWTKGETSGHLQYVKSLSIDCDNDTILAKVSQIGAACHTGNKTCFYRDLVKKEYNDHNPLKVFEDVYQVIQDRKIHPKEGSYTNYLFDKGIDKILKKVGEEATEIVISAKNPDSEEIKYEISDFLYHMMVLMVDKNISWEDITTELARR